VWGRDDQTEGVIGQIQGILCLHEVILRFEVAKFCKILKFFYRSKFLLELDKKGGCRYSDPGMLWNGSADLLGHSIGRTSSGVIGNFDSLWLIELEWCG
jgi:hypothetical protein